MFAESERLPANVVFSAKYWKTCVWVFQYLSPKKSLDAIGKKRNLISKKCKNWPNVIANLLEQSNLSIRFYSLVANATSFVTIMLKVGRQNFEMCHIHIRTCYIFKHFSTTEKQKKRLRKCT